MTSLPDLRIQHVKADEMPVMRDLRRFLYVGGYGGKSGKKVYQFIEQGMLGEPQLERLDLVLAICTELEAWLIMGKSIGNRKNNTSQIKLLFPVL